jgi:hypothetical protein
MCVICLILCSNSQSVYLLFSGSNASGSDCEDELLTSHTDSRINIFAIFRKQCVRFLTGRMNVLPHKLMYLYTVFAIFRKQCIRFLTKDERLTSHADSHINIFAIFRKQCLRFLTVRMNVLPHIQNHVSVYLLFSGSDASGS